MKAEITDRGAGRSQSVLLDGEDVSKGVRSYVITGGAQRLPRLDLELGVHENIHFVGDVEVTIPEAVRKILLHMGWTPPNAAVPQPESGSSAAGSAPPG